MTKAKYSFLQVVGILLTVSGLAGIGWQFAPRGDAVSPVPLSQLGLAVDHATKSATVAKGLPKFKISEADGADNETKNVRLWDAMLKVRGSFIPNIAQEIGDCVSWGQSNAINYLQYVQMLRGPPGAYEFKRAFPPFAYGTSRVQVGQKHGSHFRGDGSVGAYAAEAARDYGILRDDADGCPPYSGSIARQWGDKGPPKWALDAAKDYVVQTIAQVNSADEARDAIVNGYPVTIASSWWGTTSITPVDGRMVARRNTSWAHQQCLIGYDGSGKTPYFYCINSWGPKAHPAPLQGEPPGGYWIRFADVDHICGEGDSYAFSGFEGFPASSIDWDQLLRRPTPAASASVPTVQPTEVTIMDGNWTILGLCLLAVVAGVVLFRWASIGRSRVAIVMATLVGLLYGGNANGQSPDFAAASSRAATIAATPVTVPTRVRHDDWANAIDRAKSHTPQHDHWPATLEQPFGIRAKVTAEDWNQAMTRPAVGVAMRSAITTAVNERPVSLLKDTRAFMVVYGTDFCVLCKPNFDSIGTGNSQLRVQCIKAKEEDLPKFVRDYVHASNTDERRGYPVQHWTSPSGKGVMSFGVKTLDQLVQLSKTEPGESPILK